tara:strand:+ start:428 stop:808 length:381 start_codon:yes stop_codon:yes gene_type:complete
MVKLINISDLSKILDFVDPVTKKPQNHILRYWEKEFKEIKPKKINNRRYYTIKQVEVVKIIKFLLKNNGMTILGVKRLLNKKTNKLDYDNFHSLKADYHKVNLKYKSKLILEKINKIKFYGKKDTS